MRSPEAKPHKIRDRVIGSGLAVGVVGSLAWFQTHKWHEPRAEAAPHKAEKPGPEMHQRFGDLILTCHMTSERLDKPGIEGLKQQILAHNPRDNRTIFLGMFAMTEGYNGWVHNFSDPNELEKDDRVFVAEDCTAKNEPILAEMPGTL